MTELKHNLTFTKLSCCNCKTKKVVFVTESLLVKHCLGKIYIILFLFISYNNRLNKIRFKDSTYFIFIWLRYASYILCCQIIFIKPTFNKICNQVKIKALFILMLLLAIIFHKKNFEIDNSYFFKVWFNVCVCLSRCNLNTIHYPKDIVLMKKEN